VARAIRCCFGSQTLHRSLTILQSGCSRAS
jgi:hypothetical protein